MKFHFNFIGFVFVFLGVVWLLENLGLIQVSLWEIFRTWWPALLIVLGLSFFIKKPNENNNKP